MHKHVPFFSHIYNCQKTTNSLLAYLLPCVNTGMIKDGMKTKVGERMGKDKKELDRERRSIEIRGEEILF